MAREESMESNGVTQIIKGKRTKRQRSASPYKVALTTTSSSNGYGGGEGGGRGSSVAEEYGSSSPTSSVAHGHGCESTEDEDMANCLILLAQGDGPRPIEKDGFVESLIAAPKFSEMAAPTINKAGFYVYECRTCNRSFPSFQALGGHRASHKRPKPVSEEKKAPVMSSNDYLEDCQLNKSSSDFISVQIANTGNNNNNNNKGFHGTKPKIHECSICGSEFTSGQALGGHMRRHRANTGNKVETSVYTSSATMESNVISDHDHQIKPRTILSLDLNLPAPEDDDQHRESKFQFVSTQAALIFSSPALVDHGFFQSFAVCHL